MKDATGRKIRRGDIVVWSVSSGVHHVSAGRVLTDTKPIKVEVLTHTEYGAMNGKEITLGAHNYGKNALTNVIVVYSGGIVNFQKKLIKRWDEP